MTERPKTSPYRGADCKDCGRTMRISSDRVADHPGTVVHAAHGSCQPCSRPRSTRDQGSSAADHRAMHHLAAPLVIHGHDSDDLRHRINARTTQAWLDARRARGITVEGIAA
ncbi:hypothetical protein [Nesterenkonia jeotgali]|uniref:Uncharacterized protein n=1 Tax=Nesterenkonia jeotgali TaxID=317018 RepID=A0A0W8IGC8_9MICC|nr:hypothetical protein [Nesterenkonia jeotgali]KUG58953.1 hypothetical protein AVL63_02720 [Nesterenkonia jeotgali]